MSAEVKAQSEPNFVMSPSPYFQTHTGWSYRFRAGKRAVVVFVASVQRVSMSGGEVTG